MPLVLLTSSSLSDSSATGQDLLNLMEDLLPELQLQTGESDVSKGLRLLNAAQDYFESLASQHPEILGSQVGTVTTSANTETITFPSSLMRVDSLFMLGTDSRPSYELGHKKRAGSHAAMFYPWFASSNSITGRPIQYWTNGRQIFLGPVPNAAYSLRWHGFSAAANITATGSFLYPDIAMLPFATFAVQIIKTGLEDSPVDISKLAKATFDPLIASLSNFDRDGASELTYKYQHRT